MGTHRLVPHPETPPSGVRSVQVRWTEFTDGRLMLRYQVDGKDALHVPDYAGRGRADELWRTTCFELFLQDVQGPGYREYNFSPSGRWAAYGFAARREGMAPVEVDPQPEISSASGEYLFVQTVVLFSPPLEATRAAGLSAVIAERDGTKSYWALAHATDEPDFHHPACFALPLGAPATR
ncbi:hypothetical protein GCM10011371_05180 [Novosphingobium marinum]|uniref:DOMON-like domain-containing protein n=1 Tax=Novosphingobium marinum TaxID=1514948 RepID=A0A7Z0BRV4_9SPHN|nr:DOMON-like domain-containing protein [Novosphingobium marinum]NYH94206.1 hypothetical protein [Novosphingobium marinum]GGC20461.1 hypothetical protein GCM10011371_05180 [Novosphingobium marinum]